ncbi:MAG: hypothetical protein ACRCU2_31680, partial [Planktothrix sp.]
MNTPVNLEDQINQFIQEVNQVREDWRLTRVTGGKNESSGNPSCLCLWLLELTQNKSKNASQKVTYRLLYGWIISTTFQNHEQWYWTDGGRKEGLESTEMSFRIAKLTLYHEAHQIFNLVENLCRGMSLDDSCTQANIPLPKNSYGQFKLAETFELILKSFAVRPTVLLQTHASYCTKIKQFHPISSPIETVSGFSSSLWNLNKLDLFKIPTDTDNNTDD